MQRRPAHEPVIVLDTPAMAFMSSLGFEDRRGFCPAGRNSGMRRRPSAWILAGVVVGDKIFLAVGDGEFDHLSWPIAACEQHLRVLDPRML